MKQWAETNCPGVTKCMTLNKMGRGALASILSLAMGFGMTACTHDYTVSYVYMTTAKANPGLINAYEVDYQTGTLQQTPDSPIPSGGRNPITLVATPNNKFLYVVHHDDSSVVEFAIGTDGKLYPQTTYDLGKGTSSATLPSFPTAAAVDPDGKFLYVTFTYQGGYTTALQGPGGIAVFPINADNSLGTPSIVNVGRNPVGIVASSPNHFVYVIEQDSATSANLLGFSADATTGMLTPLPGVTINAGNVASTGFASGLSPSAIVEDANGQHLYVTDSVANQVVGYAIATNGVPSVLANGTATTDAMPVGLTIDYTGKFLYVVNYLGGSIDGFSFGASGEPTPSGVAQRTQAGTGPTCVTTNSHVSNPTTAQGIYLFVSNSLSNSVTGEQINPTTGALKEIINNPFSSATLPTCLVSVAAFPH